MPRSVARVLLLLSWTSADVRPRLRGRTRGREHRCYYIVEKRNQTILDSGMNDVLHNVAIKVERVLYTRLTSRDALSMSDRPPSPLRRRSRMSTVLDEMRAATALAANTAALRLPGDVPAGGGGGREGYTAVFIAEEAMGRETGGGPGRGGM